MQYLRKLLALPALALVTVAIAAATASADVVKDETLGTGAPSPTATTGLYSGPVSGTNIGADPTFELGGNTVTCDNADFTGSITGSTGAATLTFTWATGTPLPPFGTAGECDVSGTGAETCDVNDIEDVVFLATATSGGDGVFTPESPLGTFITCGAVFFCTLSNTATPATGSATDPTLPSSHTHLTAPVTATFDSTANTLTIEGLVEVTGSVGCGDTGTWRATYSVSPTDLVVWAP